MFCNLIGAAKVALIRRPVVSDVMLIAQLPEESVEAMKAILVMFAVVFVVLCHRSNDEPKSKSKQWR
jgi:hypothetical protein